MLKLYDLNIPTWANDTEGCLEDGENNTQENNLKCGINIYYSMLNEENKRIVDKLAEEGFADFSITDDNIVFLKVNCDREETIGEVSDRLLIGNTYYSFIFRNLEKIKINSKYDLVDTFNTGEIEIINKYKEKSLKLLEKRMPNSLRVGSLIDYKNRMFYVYEKLDDCVNCYEIYSNEVFEEGMADILVKGGIYKTFFATVTIPIGKLDDNGYKIRRCAWEEEIEYNKNIFSLPKKKRVNARRRLASIKEKNIDDLVPMVILKDLNNGNYYLIIDRNDNVIELVNINDISDTFYFELEKKYCPFEYYRVMSKEEYNMYLKKIKDLKEMCAVFS